MTSLPNLTDAALLAIADCADDADPVPAEALAAARATFNPFAALDEPRGGLLIQHPIFPGASSATAVLESSGPDDETCHIPCCQDDDLAICGTDVAGMRWSRLPITCAVCMDLDSTSVGECWTACPKRQGARP